MSRLDAVSIILPSDTPAEKISSVSIILPSYNPSKKIIEVIQGVISEGFSDIIIINDGSAEPSLPFFDMLSKTPGCTILNHPENRGKGAALKTGMEFYLKNRPVGIGVVTIDDDGQHLAADIARCAGALIRENAFVMGVRDFSLPEVPKKSRVGNRLASLAFKLGIGLDISDSQTGLRAIPAQYIEPLLRVKGSRFEYETNVLAAAKKLSFKIIQVPIKTVYLDGNKSTHYRALTDSLIIFLQFIKYSAGSALSFGVDLLLFNIFLYLLSGAYPPDAWLAIFLSTLCARIISAGINFIINRKIVFTRSAASAKRAIPRYILLCAAVFFLSSQLVSLLTGLPFIQTRLGVTISKIIVDGTLFILNYFIQKKWVYKS